MSRGPRAPRWRSFRGALPAAILLALLVAGCAAPPRDGKQAKIADPSVLDAVLADHVRLGRVDYAGLRNDQRLALYLSDLAEAHADPAGGRRGRMAYWINAYNAFVLKAVADRYPIGGVREIGEAGGAIGGLFRSIRFPVGGAKYSLDTIEHKILRPEFRDPRVHFALSPGTIGGPRLRSSAYHAATLDAELDQAASAFINDPAKVRLVRRERVLELSRLFEWYEEDFGRGPAPVLEYVKRYLPPADAAFLSYAEVRVRYLDYDWSLNGAEADAP